MTNKSGFTLVELLAVIVVLLILSLITIPIIVNVVKKTRMSSAKNSAMSYLSSVENYMVYREINTSMYPEVIEPGSLYQISETAYSIPDGKTVVEGKNMNSILGNSIKGEKPTQGIIELDDKTRVINSELIINGFKIICTSSSNCIVEGETKEKSKSEKITADKVGINIDGMNVDNVTDALDYIYERSR